MPKKKKNESFAEKHPMIAFLSSPVWMPFVIPYEIAKALSKKKIEDMTGYEYEQYVANKLSSMGYSHIKVTSKSGDYGADILAKYKKQSVCIQCKKFAKPVGIKAVQEITAAKVHYKCDKAMVITNNTFTSVAKKLASETDVELMDNFK